jgi:histidinol phosphatase-like PHP family hydrolase
MSLPKMNLHIHSNYSDGKQTIRQIVERSIKLNLKYIAITDHFTNSWKAWVSSLNNNETISEYLKEISQCQKYINIKKLNISLLKGIEIDLASTEQFIKKFIQINKFDLILFEYLQSYESIAFIGNLIHHWNMKLNKNEKFPILGLAHFDPSYFITGGLDTLMKFLEKNYIYFEFNPSYPEYYSPKYKRFFEKLKEHKIPVAIGCDSHSLKTLDNIEEPLEMMKYYSLESNYKSFINTLDIRHKNWSLF